MGANTMGILDKILNFMKLDGDDDYDDDDFFDEEEDFDDYPSPKKSSAKKSSVFKRNAPADDDLDDDLDYGTKPQKKSRFGGKVTPMPQAGGKMSIVVISPSSFEESREVVDTLLEMRSIILNVEGLDVDIAQRILDFVSGGALAVDGNVQFISSHIILVTPRSVAISGDIKDLATTIAYSGDNSFNKPRY